MTRDSFNFWVYFNMLSNVRGRQDRNFVNMAPEVYDNTVQIRLKIDDLLTIVTTSSSASGSLIRELSPRPSR